MEPNNDIVKLYKQAQSQEGSSGEAGAAASSANNVSCFDDLWCAALYVQRLVF